MSGPPLHFAMGVVSTSVRFAPNRSAEDFNQLRREDLISRLNPFAVHGSFLATNQWRIAEAKELRDRSSGAC
jgi:hypothetical protein